MDQQLESLNMSNSGEYLTDVGITDLIKLAGVTPNGTGKKQAIDRLKVFYNTPSELIAVWQSMTDFERACVSDILCHGGYLFHTVVEQIAKKYKIQKEEHRGRGMFAVEKLYNTYLTKKSKVALFLMTRYINPKMIDALRPYVYQKPFTAPTPLFEYGMNKAQCYLTSETIQQDLQTIIKFVGTGKVKVNASTGYMTKPNMKKLNELLNGKEYSVGYYKLEDLRNTQHLERIGGLYTLLLEGDILACTEQNEVILGKAAQTFLQRPFQKKINDLMRVYLEMDELDEVQHIRENTFEIVTPKKASKIREVLLGMISTYTPGTWYSVASLSERMFDFERTFIMRQVTKVLIREPYANYMNYFEGDWTLFEQRFIEITLLRYLAPLGIIDIEIEENTQKRPGYFGEQIPYIKPISFRITPLGAYILGQVDEYVDESLKHLPPNHLVVDNTMRISVQPSQRKLEHQIFLERYMEPLKKDEEVVYTLDFNMVLKCQEQKTSLKAIWQYLEAAATQPIPPFIKDVFEGWEQDLGKIRIRTMTVIECEDSEVLEALKTYAGVQKHTLKTYNELIEITPSSTYKVKKELEKQHHFCDVQEKEL